MVFSISDSQILFTKGQFPCLYYMPACLSRLPAGMYLSSLPSLAPCTEILHFVQNDDPGRKAPWCLASAFFPRPNDTNATPPPCHFDRSGEISLLHGTSRIGAGDLSTQSFNRVQVHLPPLRHAAPLEMTDATGCLSSLEKDRNTVTPHCHFGRSGEISLPYAANRLRLSRLPSGMYLSSLPSLASCTEILHFVQNDGPGRKAPQRLPPFPAPMTPMQHRPPVISTEVEKSHSFMVQAALGREISRLRVSIESKHICPRSGTQPRSR